MPRAQAIYAGLKPLLEPIVAGALVTTVKAGPELLGAGVGDPRPPGLPLEDEGRTALKKLVPTPDRRTECDAVFTRPGPS